MQSQFATSTRFKAVVFLLRSHPTERGVLRRWALAHLVRPRLVYRWESHCQHRYVNKHCINMYYMYKHIYINRPNKKIIIGAQERAGLHTVS